MDLRLNGQKSDRHDLAVQPVLNYTHDTVDGRNPASVGR